MSFPVIEISENQKEYPSLLREIENRPKTLYCRGNIKLLSSFSIAVIGTRKSTHYGREVTEKIISDLANYNITIVSGLALGIDSIAHQSALDNNLSTIAVLGSGVDDDSIYPSTNFQLAQNILKAEGLIVSEYSPGTPGLKHHFPERNRIVSGLSRGVLVIESPLKSGALITTRFAAEQNRDVFSVPGNIFSPNSKGPHMLIQKGAKPVFSGEDILGNYYDNFDINSENNKKISTTDPIEKKIIDILDDKGEKNIDELVSLTNLEISKIITAISMLDISGKIKVSKDKYRLK